MEHFRSRGIGRMAQVAVAAVLLLSVWPAVAAPSPGLSITMSPTSLRYELDGGKGANGTLTIINDGTMAYDFQVTTAPYNVSGEDYNQSFQLKPNQTDVSKWIKTSVIPYHLEPGKHVEVPYQIDVPVGVGPGGYYAVIFAETAAQPSSTGGVVSRKRVGAILYLRVNGQVDERGSLESFSVPFWQTEPPLKTSLRLGNQGNVHYQADSSIYVTDLFGSTKARLLTSHVVLPQTIRRIDQTWPGAPTFGLFKVFGSVNLLGRTEALPTHYVLIMSSLFFIIVVTAASLVVLICLILAVRRRRTKRKTKNQTQTPIPPPPAPRPRRRF